MPGNCPVCFEALTEKANFCQACGTRVQADAQDTRSPAGPASSTGSDLPADPPASAASPEEACRLLCEVDTDHDYVSGHSGVFSFRVASRCEWPLDEAELLFKSPFKDEKRVIRGLGQNRSRKESFDAILSTPGELKIKIVLRYLGGEGERECYSGDIVIPVADKKDVGGISINPVYNMQESRAPAVDGSIKVQFKGDDVPRKFIKTGEGQWCPIPLQYDHEEVESWIEDEVPVQLPSEITPSLFKGDRMVLEQWAGRNLIRRFVFLAKPVVKIGRKKELNDILAWEFPFPSTPEEKEANSRPEGPSSRISRQHAEIQFLSDAFFIKDEESGNRTYVKGNILKHRELLKLEDEDVVDLAAAIKFDVTIFCDRSPRTSSMMRPVLKRGDRGEDVVFLQRRLREKGFRSDDTNQFFGPALESVLKSFQRSVGLHPDGIAGPETLARLGLADRFGIDRLGPIDALRLRRRDVRPKVEEEYVILVKEAKIGHHQGNCLQIDDPGLAEIEARIYFDRHRFVFQSLNRDRRFSLNGKELRMNEDRALEPRMEIVKSNVRFTVREYLQPEGGF